MIDAYIYTLNSKLYHKIKMSFYLINNFYKTNIFLLLFKFFFKKFKQRKIKTKKKKIYKIFLPIPKK